jgi:hypothetical protein
MWSRPVADGTECEFAVLVSLVEPRVIALG